MLPNLGIALGAGTRQYLQMDKEEKDDAFRQQQIDLQKEANLRSQQMHDTQMDQIKRQNAEREAANAVWKEALPVFQGGWQAAAKHLGEAYNADDAGYGYNDGKKVNFQVHKNGVYVTPMNPDGSGGQTQFYSPEQVMQEHLRGVHARLASISPAYAQGFMSWLDGQNKEATRQKERGEDKASEQKRFDEDVRHRKVMEDMSRAAAGRAANADRRAAQDQAYEEALRAPLMNELKGYQLGAKEARKAGLGHAASLYDQAQADAVRRYATQNQPEKPRYHFNVVDDPDNPGAKIVVSGDMYTGEAKPAVGGKAEAGTEVSKPKTRAEADKYWPSYENSGRFKSKEEFYKALGL